LFKKSGKACPDVKLSWVMEFLLVIFAIAGVILGVLMVLQSIYALFKRP
jgi:hypothetical protein